MTCDVNATWLEEQLAHDCVGLLIIWESMLSIGQVPGSSSEILVVVSVFHGDHDFMTDVTILWSKDIQRNFGGGIDFLWGS